MQIIKKVVGPIHTNVYFVFDERNGDGLIIDPAFDPEGIAKTAKENGFTPKYILLTHGHFDHITAANETASRFHIPIYAMEAEKETLSDPVLNGDARFLRRGLHVFADRYLRDGETLNLLGKTWQVIWTPGHTAGSCCFYLPEEKILFSGDTLFSGSYGRCDMPGGDFKKLHHSITEKLFTLPDEVIVLPGHMEQTKMGLEKRCNPILD